ncbi:MAG: endonuclease [Bacteroidales bacterium]|nr:MAG: endonuclease [Bacteroidales bacterium]
MAEHNNLGSEGELEAARYLQTKGYDILETNWRYKRLEIDIIAYKSGLLVVVEVKTRATNRFGYPESFVTPQKMRHLITATDEYIRLTNKEDIGVRFDIIALTKNSTKFEVEHIEDAFNSIHAFGVSPSYGSPLL